MFFCLNLNWEIFADLHGRGLGEEGVGVFEGGRGDTQCTLWSVIMNCAFNNVLFPVKISQNGIKTLVISITREEETLWDLLAVPAISVINVVRWMPEAEHCGRSSKH